MGRFRPEFVSLYVRVPGRGAAFAFALVLLLQGNQLQPNQVRSFLDALQQSASPLEALSLADNTCHSAAIRGLHDLLTRPACAVKELRLDRCRINDTVLLSLCDALAVNTSVRRLHLAGNHIRALGARRLADALRLRSGIGCMLELLDVSGNHFSGSGLGLLVSGLKHHSTLTHLDISRNHFGPGVAASLVKVILSCRAVKHLDVSFAQLTEAECGVICEALHTSSISLEVLRFDGNPIGLNGATLLMEHERAVRRITVANCELEVPPVVRYDVHDLLGVYELDLLNAYHRSILQRLMRRAAQRVLTDICAGRGCSVYFREPTFSPPLEEKTAAKGSGKEAKTKGKAKKGKKAATPDASDGPAGFGKAEPFEHLSQFADVCAAATAAPTARSAKGVLAEWRARPVPTAGLVRFSFVCSPMLAESATAMRSAEVDDVVAQIKVDVQTSERHCVQMIMARYGQRWFSVKDALLVANEIAAFHFSMQSLEHAAIANLALQVCGDHGESERGQSAISAFVGGMRLMCGDDEARALRQSAVSSLLGGLAAFSPLFPTSSWAMNLEKSAERLLAKKLMVLSNEQVQVLSAAGQVDVGQTSQAGRWRNATIDSRPFCYMTDGLPTQGWLRLDFVSSRTGLQAPDGHAAHPTSEKLEEWIAHLTQLLSATRPMVAHSPVGGAPVSSNGPGLEEGAAISMAAVALVARAVVKLKKGSKKRSKKGSKKSAHSGKSVASQDARSMDIRQPELPEENVEQAVQLVRAIGRSCAFSCSEAAQIVHCGPNPDLRVEFAQLLFDSLTDLQNFVVVEQAIGSLAAEREKLHRRLGILNCTWPLYLDGEYNFNLNNADEHHMLRRILELVKVEKLSAEHLSQIELNGKARKDGIESLHEFVKDRATPKRDKAGKLLPADVKVSLQVPVEKIEVSARYNMARTIFLSGLHLPPIDVYAQLREELMEQARHALMAWESCQQQAKEAEEQRLLAQQSGLPLSLDDGNKNHDVAEIVPEQANSRPSCQCPSFAKPNPVLVHGCFYNPPSCRPSPTEGGAAIVVDNPQRHAGTVKTSLGPGSSGRVMPP